MQYFVLCKRVTYLLLPGAIYGRADLTFKEEISWVPPPLRARGAETLNPGNGIILAKGSFPTTAVR